MVVQSIRYISHMPETPAGFRAVNVGDGTSICLDWSENEESDVTQYNIHFGMVLGQYDSLKTVSTVGDTLLNLVPGTTLYIALSASDGEGYQSLLTSEHDIVVSAIPSPPEGLSSVAFENSIHLTWDQNETELDLAGYHMYRYELDGATDTTHIGSVTVPITEFTDNSARSHTLYAYYVTAVDSQVPENESAPSETSINRLATHDRGILVIDNTQDGGGGPFFPTDEDVDDFYDELLEGFNVRAHWDVAESTSISRSVMDFDLGIYSVVLCHSDIRTSPVMAPDTTTMRKYMDGGGNIWLSGWNLIESITGFSTDYYVFAPDDFLSAYMGVDSAITTSALSQDFIAARSVSGGFPDIPVNLEKTAPFGALFNMDVLLEPFDGSFAVYSYVSSDSAGAPHHGLPIAIAGSSGDSSFVFTDFPLYFMETAGARSLGERVMAMFNEPVSVEPGDVALLPRIYSVSQNYPNPFNPMTTIKYDIPGTVSSSVEVGIRIYNIRGKLTRVLLDERKKPGSYEVVWDGRDERGNSVSTGVYFYVIHAGDFHSTRKMILMK